MQNKYNCGAYDSGYCYCLARPLTDEEDDKCEDICCAYNKEESKRNDSFDKQYKYDLQ